MFHILMSWTTGIQASVVKVTEAIGRLSVIKEGGRGLQIIVLLVEVPLGACYRQHKILNRSSDISCTPLLPESSHSKESNPSIQSVCLSFFLYLSLPFQTVMFVSAEVIFSLCKAKIIEAFDIYSEGCCSQVSENDSDCILAI